MIRKTYYILIIVLSLCIGCQWHLKPGHGASVSEGVEIERYDRIESLFLTMGDYSALQQMKTVYPEQTRMLVEDVLHLGRVNDPDIDIRFLRFFQDSTLQQLINSVQQQYANIDDLNEQLADAFERMKQELPEVEIPRVYAQIGSFDQSIIVGHGSLGISLDKYLGADYPFYLEHYDERQRRMMVRSMIVPDCLSFYLLSAFPPKRFFEPLWSEPAGDSLRRERDAHMGRIQWVVNQLMGRDVFDSEAVVRIDQFMKKHRGMRYDLLLRISEETLFQVDS